MLTFTKKKNDSTTMKRTKIAKQLHYYGTERVLNSRVRIQFLKFFS